MLIVTHDTPIDYRTIYQKLTETLLSVLLSDDLNRNALSCKFFASARDEKDPKRSIQPSTRYLLNLKSISKCLLSSSSYFIFSFTIRWLKRKPFNSSQTSWVSFFSLSFISLLSTNPRERILLVNWSKSKRKRFRFMFGAVWDLISTRSLAVHVFSQ